jgi:hypothetical protein
MLVDADQSTDIRNTRRNRFVIKDGRIVRTQRAAARMGRRAPL